MISSSLNSLTVVVILAAVLHRLCDKTQGEFFLRESPPNRNLTGFGTIIGNLTANSKTSKLIHVDDRLKQRVLVHFLAAEGVSRDDMQKRLRRRFGEGTIDVREAETPRQLERRRHLHYHVVERVIIQFLIAEGVRPSDIYRRMRAVSYHGQHLCNVYRWAHRFWQGRRDVANQPSPYKPRTRGTRRPEERRNRTRNITV